MICSICNDTFFSALKCWETSETLLRLLKNASKMIICLIKICRVQILRCVFQYSAVLGLYKFYLISQNLKVWNLYSITFFNNSSLFISEWSSPLWRWKTIRARGPNLDSEFMKISGTSWKNLAGHRTMTSLRSVVRPMKT